MKLDTYLEKVKGGLIVSCQALEDEPLHSSFIMGKMALAAKQGGANGIRANSVVDIIEIKKNVDLPVIGIIKKNFDDSDVYITPTMQEIDALVTAGADVIATDATKNIRPNGENLEEFVSKIKEKYKDILLMADISNLEEALKADKLGFDIISTTLSGYTPYTIRPDGPDYKLLEDIKLHTNKPVFVEGKINTPQEAKRCIENGAFAVVVGAAITRPHLITKRFTDYIKGVNCS